MPRTARIISFDEAFVKGYSMRSASTKQLEKRVPGGTMKNYFRQAVLRASGFGVLVAIAFIGLSALNYNQAYEPEWLPYQGGAFFGFITFVTALAAFSAKRGWWPMFLTTTFFLWSIIAAMVAGFMKMSILHGFPNVAVMSLVLAVSFSYFFTMAYYRWKG